MHLGRKVPMRQVALQRREWRPLRPRATPSWPKNQKKFPIAWKFWSVVSAMHVELPQYAPNSRNVSKENESTDCSVCAPAHPYTGRALWQKLRRALAEERGYKMTFQRVGSIMGRSTSTAEHWLSLSDQPHVRGFVCLLERLSEDERRRVMGEVCRVLPSVLHPCLAHSPRTVGRLVNLLQESKGLTIVAGGSARSRSFVLGALAHTFPQLDRRHRTAGGLDIYQPDKLVPIETVIYLRTCPTRERLQVAAQHAWPQVRISTAPLLIFNQVWSLLPDCQSEILNWSGKRHVIIADSHPPSAKLLPRLVARPLHVLTVSPLSENSGRIQVLWYRARK
jgi:hypothetical protein